VKVSGTILRAKFQPFIYVAHLLLKSVKHKMVYLSPVPLGIHDAKALAQKAFP
jgi:hypothetical protein